MKTEKKKIDFVLRELGDLYDFNREIRKFHFKDRRSSKTEEQASRTVPPQRDRTRSSSF